MTRDANPAQAYSYAGNQLMGVTGGTSRAYTYDDNGNALSDGTNTFTYNVLNLPATVSGPNASSYTYDATGKKLSRTSASGTTQYVDGIQYNGTTIDLIQTEEGLARRNTDTEYLYQDNLTDHLGNNRYTFDSSGGVVQYDDYYPFGLSYNSFVSGTRNNYFYKGKELQPGLEQYDYGARFYDPVIGRWNVIDPLAEKNRRFSPYAYVDNNPLRFIDPDGMESDDIIYKNRETEREVGRLIMPGDDVIKLTNAKSLKELIANNFDGPKLSQGKASTAEESASRAYAYQQSQQDVDYQDMSQPTTSLAVAKNVAYGFATEFAGAQVASGVKSLFSAGKAGSVFWSGGTVAKTAAAEFAGANGMKTLEMTTGGRIMDAISSYLPKSVSTPMWNSMSRTFAEGAAGEAHFFTIPAGPRSGSIWLNVEKPILEKNAVQIISH